MKRRTALKLLSAGAGLFVSESVLHAWPSPRSLTRRATPLTGNPLRFPPTVSGGTLTLAETPVEVWPSTVTQAYTINGNYPGPIIRVNRGDTLAVDFYNSLSEETTVHWHGMIIPALQDGHPAYPIPSGGRYAFSFPIFNRAGTYAYHAHPHQLTGKQVWKGFAGLLVVDDPGELAYGLPQGEFDIPLVLQDHRSSDAPGFVYNPGMMDVMTGFRGDTVLVNGTPDPYMEVAPTLYRFRIANVSNSRIYYLALSNGQSFHVIGNDGGLIDAPVEVTSAFLAPVERLDILVDFSALAPGETVTLESHSFSTGAMGGTYPQGTPLDLLRFDVTLTGSSGGAVPTAFAPIERYLASDVVKYRSFNLSMVMAPSGMHQINSRSFVMDRIDEEITLNDLEEWTIFNQSTEWHPVHIHGVQFQVTERNGSVDLPPVESGWKDTVLVRNNDLVKLRVKFTDYTGIYLIHCHNLEHEDDGMMLNLRINPDTTGGVEEDAGHERGIIRVGETAEGVTVTFASTPFSRRLSVFDLLGREVATLNIQPGATQAVIHHRLLRSGFYVGRLGTNSFRFVLTR